MRSPFKSVMCEQWCFILHSVIQKKSSRTEEVWNYGLHTRLADSWFSLSCSACKSVKDWSACLLLPGFAELPAIRSSAGVHRVFSLCRQKHRGHVWGHQVHIVIQWQQHNNCNIFSLKNSQQLIPYFNNTFSNIQLLYYYYSNEVQFYPVTVPVSVSLE